MENLSKDRINQATELYGQPIVAAVLVAIAVAGPEGAHAAYIDLDMPQHADCVQFLHPDESESEQFITFG